MSGVRRPEVRRGNPNPQHRQHQPPDGTEASGTTNPEDAIPRTQIPSVIARELGARPSSSTVYRWIRKGRIPAFRLTDGGPLYVRLADVQSYAEKQRAAGASTRGAEAAAAYERIRNREERQIGGRR